MRNFLWPLAILFRLIVWFRGKLYELKIFPQRSIEKPVLCVGNLSAGGTGKTPWVQLLSQYFIERNRVVTILSRGYSGDFSGVLEVKDDMDPRKCGDEPLWLKKNTKAQVYVGRNRKQAAQEAMSVGSTDLFILDDGFQHQKLRRDLDLVLLDASAPRHHYHLLPVGYLREDFAALKRADLVVINKCNYASPENLEWLYKRTQMFVAKDQIFSADFVFSHWEPLVEGEGAVPPSENTSMTCGVGNPQAFIKTLENIGLKPVKQFIFPDHYYWKPDDIERMTYNMKRVGSSNLVMTEKDAVKLNRYKKHFAELKIQLWVCKMKVQLREDATAFFSNVEKLLW